MRALSIYHLRCGWLQRFDTALREAGWEVEHLLVGEDDLAAVDAAAPDLLVLLGGPMSVYEPDKWPFLADEARIVEQRLASGRPLYGSCMGAQLIARVAGAPVYRGRHVEAGWSPITLTDAGRGSPLAPLEGAPVLHWHRDTFELPAGAIRLASTDLYENQAFSLGPNVLACQFHLEAWGAVTEQWLISHADQIDSTSALDYAQLRADFAAHADATADIGARVLLDWLTRADR